MARIDPALFAECEAAARRPLAVRWSYSFIRTYKPVLDDAEYRSFDTMEEYRQWCERELPDWLGYGRVRVRRQGGIEPGKGPRVASTVAIVPRILE